MSFCPQCGSRNVDGAKFCESCGATLIGSAPAFVSEEDTRDAFTPEQAAVEPFDAEAYEQPYDRMPEAQQVQSTAYRAQSQPYQGEVVGVPQPLSPKCKTFGIISFVLGLWSTVFCWLGAFPAVGIALGFLMIASAIVGLIFSGISRREGNFKLARLGKVFSIIGLILSALLFVVGIILTIIAASNGAYRN